MQNIQNTLYTADNLFILNGLNSQSVDLIYLDPPFNSKRLYAAPIGSQSAGVTFKDMWTWQDVNEAYLENLIDQYPSLVRFIQSIQDTHSKSMMAYITYMTQRLLQMHRVLKDTGSLYLHVDPTASHYLKIVLDRIFGKQNFKNEIVWNYGKWSNVAKYFQRNHDIILFYSKSDNYIFYPIYVPKQNIKPYHTNIINGKGQLLIYDIQDTSKEVIEKYKRKGYKVINVEKKKAAENDTWSYLKNKKLNILNSQSKERTGYPTQKPLALLERIIKASSREGDVVLDPFCGCATTCVKAQQLGRKWIGVDIAKKAVDILIQRLSNDAGMFKDFLHTQKPPQRTDIEKIDKNTSVKKRLYEQQNGKCSGCNEEFNIYNFEIDHIIPKSKGGGDYYENYQLLCPNCNRIKGDRPMEYLRIKIKAREKLLNQTLSFGD